MKIIRRSLLVLGITLTSISSINLHAEDLSAKEQEAITLAIKLIEGDAVVSRKKLNEVCMELSLLMRESTQWPELRALLNEYAQLDVTKLTFVTRTKKLKEICDRLIDLKNRNKLPTDLREAVEQEPVFALLNRLKAMLQA